MATFAVNESYSRGSRVIEADHFRTRENGAFIDFFEEAGDGCDHIVVRIRSEDVHTVERKREK